MASESSVPLIVSDVNLMSPGNWNGWNYTPEELKKAFSLKDYNSEEMPLFLDHPENPNNAAGAWVGRVRNMRQLPDSTILGDLEIYDEKTVFNLKVGKARFGVSPRILGIEDKRNNRFTNMIFDNWSIVSKPAQSTAMINLSQNISFNGLQIKNLSIEDSKKEKDLSNESNHIYPEKDSSIKLKGGKEKKLKMEEENKEVVKEEEKPTEEKAEEVKTEEVKPEEKAEDKELSDSDVLSIMNNNFEEFNSYASGVRVKKPTASLKELARGFQDYQKKMSVTEDLSEAEATVLLKRLLSKMGVSELAAKETKSDAGELGLVKELSSKLESMDKKISELSRPKTPSPKTVKGTPVNHDLSRAKLSLGGGPSEASYKAAEVLQRFIK